MALTRLQTNQIAPAASTSTVTAGSQAAMLALSAQTNDICIRTDVKKTFVLTGADATNLAHWQELYAIDQANVAITGGTISGISITGLVVTGNTTGTSFGTISTTIDTFDMNEFRSAKYIVSITNNTNYQVSEILILHTGVDTLCSIYNTISSTGNAFASFSSNINGSNIELQAMGTNEDNVAKLQKIYIPG